MPETVREINDLSGFSANEANELFQAKYRLFVADPLEGTALLYHPANGFYVRCRNERQVGTARSMGFSKTLARLGY